MGCDVQALTKHRGLRNLGNTCYVNSFVQALAATRDFTSELLRPSATFKTGHVSSAFFTSIRSTIYHLVQPEPSAYAPHDLISSLPEAGFAKGRQHDAQEFALSVINKIACFAPNATRSFVGQMQEFVKCHGCGKTTSRATVMNDLEVSLPPDSTDAD